MLIGSTFFDAFGEGLSLLAIVVGPLILYTWIIHWLEFLIQRRLSQRFGWNSVLWTGWLGTPVHELSHALMCLVFRHEIVDMALFRPDRVNRRLGYVVHSHERGNLYQEIGNFFIGVAPLIGGTAVLTVLLILFYPDTSQQSLLHSDPAFPFWNQVWQSLTALFSGLFQPSNLLTVRLWLFVYLVICVGSHMAPSGDDYRGALQGGIWVGGFTLLVCWLVTSLTPESTDLFVSLQSFLVPVVTILTSVILLCGLATAMVYLVTDLLDVWRPRNASSGGR